MAGLRLVRPSHHFNGQVVEQESSEVACFQGFRREADVPYWRPFRAASLGASQGLFLRARTT